MAGLIRSGERGGECNENLDYHRQHANHRDRRQEDHAVGSEPDDGQRRRRCNGLRDDKTSTIDQITKRDNQEKSERISDLANCYDDSDLAVSAVCLMRIGGLDLISLFSSSSRASIRISYSPSHSFDNIVLLSNHLIATESSSILEPP
jgi:hypothetical protein